jgi:iron complex outermembrane receptor protein
MNIKKIGVAFVLPFAFSGVQAQDATGQIEEIVVQGTATGTGIRGVAPVGSQTLTLTRETLLESPIRDSAEIIATMPQGSQIDSGVNEGAGYNETGGAGLNLRGLGPNASLMLLDGHRMAGQGANTIAPDPSAIPFAAIERVEVVLDGASSVYGSDAVAGVVNFRMRDDFEGADIQFSGQRGVYDSSKIELVLGKTFDNGNIMLGLTREYVSPMMASERDYLRSDLTQYGGKDNRTGQPQTVVFRVDSDYYVPVAGWTGVDVGPYNGVTLKVPTLAEMRLATDADWANPSETTNYRGSNDRRNAFLRVGFDFHENIRIDYTGMISERESQAVSYRTAKVDITQYSPYYISGLTATANKTYSALYNTAAQNRTWITENFFRTMNHYVDVTVDFDEYQFTASASFGDTKGCDICRPEGNNAALRHDPAGTPDGYMNYLEVGTDSQGRPRGNNPEWYNPYSTAVQPNVRDKLIGDTYRSGDQSMAGLRMQLEGPLMDIAGGTIRGSVGAEYVDSNHWLWLNQDVRYYPVPTKKDYVLRDTTYSRETSSIFAELYVPLIGDANAMPGIQRLAANFSVRRDDYSDFGATTNPRLGITWDVNDDLSIRGSWGTAFRAPTLDQVNPGTQTGVGRSVFTAYPNLTADHGIPITEPADGETDIFTIFGKNPNLGPELADMWSVGFDYSPYMVEGLNVQFTYYDINYEDRIERLPNSNLAFSSADYYDLYSPFITTFTPPAGCIQGQLETYAPELSYYLNWPGSRFAGGPGDCNIGAVLENTLQNVGSLSQQGIDTQVSYRWENDMGLWSVSGNVAKILGLERTLIDGGEWFSVLDIYGWQTSLRANGRLSWSRDNWSAALSARVEGSYLNDQNPNGDQEVDAWTTFDGTLAYRTPDDGSMLGGLSVSLGIQNLTDKEPPIVLTARSAVDINVHNVFGRMIRLEVGKQF